MPIPLNEVVRETKGKSLSELNKYLDQNGTCGPEHYIYLDITSGGELHAKCRSCDGIDKDHSDAVQCKRFAPPQSNRRLWYEEQLSMNVKEGAESIIRKDWSVANIINKEPDDSIPDLLNGKCTEPDQKHNISLGCEILSYYDNTALPMSDEELLQIFGKRDNSMNKYILEEEYGSSIDELRENINTSKGGNVNINNNIIDKWLKNYNDLHAGRGDSWKKPTGYVKEDLDRNRLSRPWLGGKYTKKHIIPQEAYEYQLELIEKKSKRGGEVSGFNFQQLFSGAASSSEFELCMNTLLGDDSGESYCEGKTNHDVQEEIASVNNVLGLKPCHINYIEDKLKRISIVEVTDAQECMAILNLSERICEQDVSTKMLEVAYLIFHTIGLDQIDLQNIKPGSAEYIKLTNLVDRLTPYIKMAIKKIIDISKYYEETTCERQSTTTHVLERIYIDLFEKSKEVSINFNALDLIPTYLIRDTNIEEFVKTIILMVIAIAAVYVLLMILNRPPVPVAK